jgi:hypothetical protein
VSVIWDLLRDARISSEDSPRAGEACADNVERRQSSRISMYVPVFVYGYTASDEPFHQHTNTLQVNVNGGLLHLNANVRYGQKLLVMNRVTHEEQPCYVVTLARGSRHSDVRVGVAFANSAPGFWCEKQK